MYKELHTNGALLVSMVTNINEYLLENGPANSVRCKCMSTKTKKKNFNPTICKEVHSFPLSGIANY